MNVGIAYLESKGYRVKVMPHARESLNFVSASEKHRAEDLHAAFADPEVDGVLCARGGYGTARLMPFLDIAAIAASGKLFIGYSDITHLHLALNAAGLPTLHARMACMLGEPMLDWEEQNYHAALAGCFETYGAPRGRPVVSGTAEGEVVGGCLTMLADGIGTPYALQGKGKIVLIEDTDEAAYRCDARLTQLLHSGALEGVAGIVIGEMSNGDHRNPEDRISWREVIQERLAPLGVPIMVDLPFGHQPAALAIPLGLRARMDADAGTLTYIEPLWG